MSSSLNTLIVGAGPQGCIAAVHLIASGIDRDRIAIVDPSPALRRWSRNAANCGMTHMRSPWEHSLSPHEWEMADYFGHQGGRHSGCGESARRSDRPTVEQFHRHSEAVMDRFRLDDIHLTDSVTNVHPPSLFGGLRVDLERGELKTDRVILALGPGSPARPYWGSTMPHIFDPRFDLDSLPQGSVVVVGAGMSGVQTALKLARERPGEVTLLTRTPIRPAVLDGDPEWSSEWYVREALHGRTALEREYLVREASNASSVTPALIEQLLHARCRGELDLVIGEVVRVCKQCAGTCLEVCEGAVMGSFEMDLPVTREITAQHVVLATGFSDSMPELMDEMVSWSNLPTDGNDRPLLGSDLSWGTRRIRVLGPHARSRVGPFAGNIRGAHIGMEMILS